jgi:hypothetical protein
VCAAHPQPAPPVQTTCRPNCCRAQTQPRARPINERHRWFAQARKKEIADRKWRNHMRDMLFIIKGAPSTSPFSTWINDPREPEELPPDWTPQQPATITVPDDPPF